MVINPYALQICDPRRLELDLAALAGLFGIYRALKTRVDVDGTDLVIPPPQKVVAPLVIQVII